MKLTTQKLKQLIREGLNEMRHEQQRFDQADMGRSPEEIEAEMKSIKTQIEQLKDPKAIDQLRQYLDDLLIDLADAM
jgi:hypothetical protein